MDKQFEMPELSLPSAITGKEYLTAISNIEGLTDEALTKYEKVSKLLKISPWILEQEVGLYIRANPEKVKSTVREIQKCGCLTDKQFLAAVFMTVLIGDSLLTTMPAMLTYYKLKMPLLVTLEPALTKQGVSKPSASWILRNLKSVKDETLWLAEYL